MIFLFLLSFCFSSSFYNQLTQEINNPSENFILTHPDAPLINLIQKKLEEKKELSSQYCKKFFTNSVNTYKKCLNKINHKKSYKHPQNESEITFLFKDKNYRIKHLNFLCYTQTFLFESISFLPKEYDAIQNHKIFFGPIYRKLIILKKNKNHQEAINLLLNNQYYEDEYSKEWNEIYYFYAKELLNQKKYKEAIDLILKCKINTQDSINEKIQFLKGLLNFILKNKKKAYNSWFFLYQKTHDREIKAQSLYWMSRCKNKNKWLHKALDYPLTFYGEIAGIILKKSTKFSFKEKPLKLSFYQNELLSLDRNVKRSIIIDFIERSILDTKNFSTANYLVQNMEKKFGPYYAIWTAKRLGKKFCIKEAYPKINPLILNDILQLPFTKDPLFSEIMLHSIVRQESLFDPLVKSHAQAIGLSQLRQTTADEISAQLYKKYNINLKPDLLQEKNNLIIGLLYIHNLLNSYNANFIFMLCAYNAGPHKINSWIKNNDFKKDPFLWIELIPYFETRIYVKRILVHMIRYAQKTGHDIKPLIHNLFFQQNTI